MFCRRFVQNYAHWTTCSRKLLSSAVNEGLVSGKVSRRTSKSNKYSVSSEIRNQLRGTDLEYFIDHIPRKILRKQCKTHSNVYLINHDAAKLFSSMISEDLLENTSYVIECNPGLGLLTQELLNNGVPKINVYEKCNAFLKSKSPLDAVFKKYQNCLELKQLNFFDIWMTLLHDKYNDDTLAEIYLMDAPYHPWGAKPFAQIIAAFPGRYFITLLIHNFIHQTSIFDHGRPVIYMALPSQTWMRITTDNKDIKNIRFYSHYSVILHVFFQFKRLGELPRKAFAPWPAVKPNSKADELESPMAVIKIEPKASTNQFLKKDDIHAFWFFLKHCMRSRKNKVITEFEKFVPGCGPKLIELDIDICTTFKELDPKKLLAIFRNFRSWPEYDENMFIPITGNVDEAKKHDEEKLEEEEHEHELPPTMPETSDSESEKKEN